MGVIKDVTKLTTAMMDYDPNLVIIARQGFKKANNTTNYIVIDNIVSSAIGKFRLFDGDTEEMKYTTRYAGNFQALFYGEEAESVSGRWCNMIDSELSRALQRQHSLSVLNPSTLNNIKVEDGSSFNNLYVVEFNVKYDIATVVPMRRIDTAELEFIDN